MSDVTLAALLGPQGFGPVIERLFEQAMPGNVHAGCAKVAQGPSVSEPATPPALVRRVVHGARGERGWSMPRRGRRLWNESIGPSDRDDRR